MAARLLRATSDASFLTVSDVLVIVWHGEMSPQSLAMYEESFADMATAYPAGFSVLAVIEPCAGQPDGAARAALARIFGRYEQQLRAVCVAIEGGGFRIATIRMIVTSIATMVRRRYPLSIQGTGHRAADWISIYSPSQNGAIGVKRLDDAIESVRGGSYSDRGIKARAV
jgi:hypothetical protein